MAAIFREYTYFDGKSTTIPGVGQFQKDIEYGYFPGIVKYENELHDPTKTVTITITGDGSTDHTWYLVTKELTDIQLITASGGKVTGPKDSSFFILDPIGLQNFIKDWDIQVEYNLPSARKVVNHIEVPVTLSQANEFEKITISSNILDRNGSFLNTQMSDFKEQECRKFLQAFRMIPEISMAASYVNTRKYETAMNTQLIRSNPPYFFPKASKTHKGYTSTNQLLPENERYDNLSYDTNPDNFNKMIDGRKYPYMQSFSARKLTDMGTYNNAGFRKFVLNPRNDRNNTWIVVWSRLMREYYKRGTNGVNCHAPLENLATVGKGRIYRSYITSIINFYPSPRIDAMHTFLKRYKMYKIMPCLDVWFCVKDEIEYSPTPNYFDIFTPMMHLDNFHEKLHFDILPIRSSGTTLYYYISQTLPTDTPPSDYNKIFQGDYTFKESADKYFSFFYSDNVHQKVPISPIYHYHITYTKVADPDATPINDIFTCNRIFIK